MYDILIIGGGPAGLTAAIYAIRKRLDVMLVASDLGGKTNFYMDLKDGEENLVIRGTEMVDKFKRELEYLNFARMIDTITRVDRTNGHFTVHTVAGEEIQARAVVVATGARVQWLEVPGEKEFTGKGLGYSALSYAPLFLDKRAVVVGNGELALRSAAELATVAAKVHLIGPSMALMESPLGQKLLEAANVHVMGDHRVIRIQGNSHCDSVMVESPEGLESEIKTDGVFVEMAVIPNSEMVSHLVDCDERGHIIVDSFSRTSVPGLFAAGDVATTTEQVLVAIGEGAKAALSAYDFLLPTL
jgi:alkyl hydroperoxide reductase subunit F